MQKLSAIEVKLSSIESFMKGKTSNNKKEILTAKDVMDLLGINRTTFNSWKKIGFIKVYSINRRLYCKYSEILEALESGIIEQKSQ